MTKSAVQFGDEEGAFIESFGNGINKDISKIDNTQIDYLGHIKAGIEVINKKENISESVQKRVNQIFLEYDLINISIDNKGIAHFQDETKEKILSMIEIVLINYGFEQKK